MKALYALTNRCAGFGLQMAKGVQRALFLNRMARAAGIVPDQKQKPKKQKKVEAKSRQGGRQEKQARRKHRIQVVRVEMGPASVTAHY